MDRRTFLKSASAAVAGTSLLSACANEETEMPNSTSINRFGVGLFTIPMWLEQDFGGTLAKLAEIGYKELEFYGPFPFSVQAAHDSWNAITPNLPFSGSGYFGHTAKEVRAMLDANGLTAPSMHVDLGTLENNLDELVEMAGIMGHKYAGIAAIPEEERKTLDEYRRMADRFNNIGMKLKDAGMQFMYHNHGYGLVEMDGEIPFRIVLDRTEPDYVAMEMDVFWTVAGKADPIAYLDEYPGRYKLMHLKDMIEMTHFEGDGGSPDEWIELFPQMADAGMGVLDLKAILAAAHKAGVDHYYLERDMAAEPEKTLKDSYTNLVALAG